MSLFIGDRMRRLNDGVAGVVEYHQGEARIIYLVHGERCVAGRNEKWEPADPPHLPLREEERKDVAMAADQMLRSIIQHQPNRFWEPPGEHAFDPGLVTVIMDYLKNR